MPAPTPLRFGPFTLDLAASQLRRGEQVLALRPKAYDLLLALVSRPGELLTKDELLDTVWGRRFISEGVIKSTVSELRQALGDDPARPRWIETVARRGYRFIRLAPTAVAPPHADVDAGESVDAPQPAALVHARDEPSHGAPFDSTLGPERWSGVLGRDLELARLAAALDTHRLVTIAGPSGVGKTSVAQALMAGPSPSYPDGHWFVALVGLVPEATDERQLCTLLARSLRLGAASAQGGAALGRALRPLALLLVLDNAEHLLKFLAPLVATLLSEAPGLRIVVTSQEPLNLPGEQVHRLGPLSLPVASDDADAQRLMQSSAVQLFIERVADRMPGFALAPGQQRAVAEICRALEGLPLALELAAARVPVLGVHGIAALLLDGDGQARLRLLGAGSRHASGHQRSLHDALSWSHGLLDERQRRVFRHLGVFRGSFSMDAAQALCADAELDGWGVVDVVHALVDKSLVGVPPSLEGPPRFLMLESMRAFALAQLAEASETESARARHARVVCAYWEGEDTRVFEMPLLPWLARQLPELDDLRAALRWATSDTGSADVGLALMGHSALVWPRAGMVAEGRAWCESMRGHAEASPQAPLRRAHALAVSVLSMYGMAYPSVSAIAGTVQTVDDYAAAGDAVHAYFACHLAYQLGVQAHDDAVRPLMLRRMAELERPEWSEVLLRYGRSVIGYEHRLQGRTAEYLAYCRSELALCRRLGAVAEAWTAAHGLMLAESDAGETEAALAVGRQALDEIRAAGRLRQHAQLLALWTTLLAASGDGVATRIALCELMPVLHGAGTVWMAHVALAWLASIEGHDATAARIAGWQASHERHALRLASGGSIAQARSALHGRLSHRLGPDVFSRELLAGAELGDDVAEHLAMHPLAGPADGHPTHGVAAYKPAGKLPKRAL